MRAILLGPVIGAGDAIEFLRSLRVGPQDLCVGVDGGTQVWLDAGYRPHFAVGDWDSLRLKNKILPGIPTLSLSKNKDRSDLYFAARAAMKWDIQELICLGVTGGERFDHHLATLYDLSIFASGKYGKLKSVSAIGVEGEYHFLSEAIPQWKGSFLKRRLVSVFAMGGRATGVTFSGFQFLLKNATLFPSSLGLSNWTQKRKCEVHLRKGQLLVILPRNGVN